MSHAIEIQLEAGTKLPSAAEWNGEIERAGFDVVLDDFDWSSFSGFLPARLAGAPTGFELFLEQSRSTPVAQPKRGLFGRSKPAPAPAPASGPVVSFVLHSAYFGSVAASIASVVLREMTSGAVSYEDDPMDAEEAIEEARQQYLEATIIIPRLDEGENGLAWDAPELMAGETAESRKELLAGMPDLRRVEGTSDDEPAYRIHKLRGEDYRKELARQ